MSKFVITGIGVVSSIGDTKEIFWNNMQAGMSGLKGNIHFVSNECDCKNLGCIPDFEVTDYINAKGLRYIDRVGQIALAAGSLSIKDSGFVINDNNCYNCGIALGNTFGSLKSITDFDIQALKEGYNSINPIDFANTVINSAAGNISIKLGIRGANVTIASGIASSLDAMGYCIDHMESHEIDMFLCGGVEEISAPVLEYFKSIGLCNEGVLENENKGLILGEGSAFFTIESKKNAIGRNANIYAHISGYSRSTDTKSTGECIERTVANVLKESNKGIEDISVVVTSANGTSYDIHEINALKKVFGKRFDTLKLFNIKELIGETYSASGAFSILAALGIIKDMESKTGILVNSFCHNGNNTSIILEP